MRLFLKTFSWSGVSFGAFPPVKQASDFLYVPQPTPMPRIFVEIPFATLNLTPELAWGVQAQPLPAPKDYRTPFYEVVRIIEGLNLAYNFSQIQNPRHRELAMFAAGIYLSAPPEHITLEMNLNSRLLIWQQGYSPTNILQTLIHEVKAIVHSFYADPSINEITVLRDFLGTMSISGSYPES